VVLGHAHVAVDVFDREVTHALCRDVPDVQLPWLDQAGSAKPLRRLAAVHATFWDIRHR